MMRNKEIFQVELESLFDILHGRWYLDKDFQLGNVFCPVKEFIFDKNRDKYIEKFDYTFPWYFTEIVGVSGNVYKFLVSTAVSDVQETELYIEKINGTNIRVWGEVQIKYLYKKDLSGVMTIINDLLTDEEE